MKFFVTLAWTMVAAAVAGAQSSTAQPRVAPTVDQILSLKRVGSPEISPDGRRVAYTVRETNWDDNTYDTQIWLADATTGALQQLTTAKKSSQSPAWSPDGTRLGFISDRTDKRQLYVINPLGGEAEALTSLEEGVSNFAWAPDGEVFVANKKLTSMNSQTTNWTTSTLELVSWKSQDGAAIEGVLHKTLNFDPARKYPLLVVIHGGPTGVSRAVPFTSAIYPIDVWMAQDVVVLEPNYRGSAG